MTAKRWAWKQPSLKESVTAQWPSIGFRTPKMERDLSLFTAAAIGNVSDIIDISILKLSVRVQGSGASYLG